MKYTPRQMAAFIQLADRRQFGEDSRLVRLLRLAQADTRDVVKALRKLDEEAM